VGNKNSNHNNKKTKNNNHENKDRKHINDIITIIENGLVMIRIIMINT